MISYSDRKETRYGTTSKTRKSGIKLRELRISELEKASHKARLLSLPVAARYRDGPRQRLRIHPERAESISLCLLRYPPPFPVQRPGWRASEGERVNALLSPHNDDMEKVEEAGTCGSMRSLSLSLYHTREIDEPHCGHALMQGHVQER